VVGKRKESGALAKRKATGTCKATEAMRLGLARVRQKKRAEIVNRGAKRRKAAFRNGKESRSRLMEKSRNQTSIGTNSRQNLSKEEGVRREKGGKGKRII